MSVEIIERDLMSVTEGVVCHQVNCMGKMGKGLALQIRTKWPKAYKEYLGCLAQAKDCPWMMLGTANLVEAKRGNQLFVANLFAQYDYGTDYRRTEYGSLISSLDNLKYQIQMYRYKWIGDIDLYVPFNMGCVNGGGDWNIVESIIRKSFESSSHNVYICKQ